MKPTTIWQAYRKSVKQFTTACTIFDMGVAMPILVDELERTRTRRRRQMLTFSYRIELYLHAIELQELLDKARRDNIAQAKARR
jgi:hypothetical protein